MSSSLDVTRMIPEPGQPDDLARLRKEREAADRAYNDALTALDAALQQLRNLPSPPPPFDDTRMAALNEQWAILGGQTSGLLGFLKWPAVTAAARRQQVFNSTLVDHLNRQAEVHRATTASLVDLMTVVREELSRLAHFQSRLIQYAQQITPFVDTKDRYIAALPQGLAAGLSGLSDDIQKRWESMLARERRYEAQAADSRSTLAVVHRALMAMKREVERLSASPAPVGTSEPVSTSSPGALNAYKYVGFEDQFRGSTEDIRDRAAAYVNDFAGAHDVLDVGCGRGEFLDLLRERGITARGVDLNDEMAAICRERGLQAVAGDALTYLKSLPDESLGGLFAAQVVEHLDPDYLMALLEAAYHKLRPGSKIILETINPACWYAFFSSYIRDITHVRPLHPETLQYLLTASGFQQASLRYSAPASDELRLHPIRTRAENREAVPSDLVEAFNANVEKLNGLLFSYLDYAAIGVRL